MLSQRPGAQQRLSTSVLLFALECLLVCSCGSAAHDTLTCTNLLPVEQVSYKALASLVVGPGPKACSTCHNARTPVYGYDFEGPGVAYDALSTKAEIIYADVASGAMPKAGATWSVLDLQLFRSWYCYGAAYETQ